MRSIIYNQSNPLVNLTNGWYLCILSILSLEIQPV
ncbi:hypothetical protein cbdbA302 [Dehalococcoides mccartyi CBDB1]|uniref:Uncharacterized protein n=1 Tax=Dehalococcoides mccartyi (strain CBDB1) TaxID=255470 RepID=A0A916P3I3_DEHMC|nr:hypothetical protein cbdbA302 [Dehalococcoides mccartyi CBDB1]